MTSKLREAIARGRKLPVILQTEAAECGLAALAMVAAFHGYRSDLNALRRRFPISRRGSTLADLLRLAAALELVGRPLRVELEKLRELECPAILHWRLDHFVVLERADKRGIVVHDPAVGRRRYTLEEASACFSGIALELRPAASFRKQQAVRRVRLDDFWSRSTGLASTLVQLLGLSVVLQVFTLLSPLYMQVVVDEALAKGDVDLLGVIASGFLLVMLIAQGVTWLRSFIAVHVGGLLSFQMAGNLFRHLLRLPVGYFEKRHMGDIVSRFGSLEEVRKLLSEGVVSAALDGLMASVTLVMMFVYSPLLASTVVGAAALYLCARLLRFPYERRGSEERVVANARQSSVFMENVRSILSIKVFGREAEQEARYANAHAEAVNADVRLARFGINVSLLNGLIQGIENIAVVYLGGRLVLQNDLTVGMLLAFMAYKRQFGKAVISFIEEAIAFKMLGLHLERIGDIALEERELPADGEVVFSPELDGTVELDRVSYRYGVTDPLVLENVSLRIGAGECLMLEGKSGCGKTTLMKLLMGLLEPATGELRINDEPIGSFGREHYRRQIAGVMQGDALMSGTIEENIAFFSRDHDPSRVRAAARAARIDAEIACMPMKYDTLVGDLGANMSYGQRQRLLLARAIYASPKVLFLDEATSHVDLATEQEIMREIKQMGITTVVISHRPEVLEMADRSFAVEGGALRRVDGGRGARPRSDTRPDAGVAAA